MPYWLPVIDIARIQTKIGGEPGVRVGFKSLPGGVGGPAHPADADDVSHAMAEVASAQRRKLPGRAVRS